MMHLFSFSAALQSDFQAHFKQSKQRDDAKKGTGGNYMVQRGHRSVCVYVKNGEGVGEKVCFIAKSLADAGLCSGHPKSKDPWELFLLLHMCPFS